MRRFVNEALRKVSLLEEHVTTWMAEEPDPIESDPDGALTDRQRVLVFAGCIKGTLEAGVTSTETTGTDHSSDLAAAVGRVRELEGALKLALLREPTREELEAALCDKDEAFLNGTVRRCIDCRTPVYGGPTRCIRCAERVDLAAAESRATAADATICTAWKELPLCDSATTLADAVRAQVQRATAAERERDEAMGKLAEATSARDAAWKRVSESDARCTVSARLVDELKRDRDELLQQRNDLRAKLRDETNRAETLDAECLNRARQHGLDTTTINSLRAKLAEAERQLDEWHRSRGFAYSSQPSPVVPNNPAYVAASPKSLTPCDDCPERQKDGSCPLSPEQCAKQAPFAGVNRADFKTLAEAMATLPEGYGGPAQAIAGAEAYLAESRLTRYAALERAVREMHPGNWSPNVVHALDSLTHAPSAPDDERGCPTCATLAGKIERLRAEVEHLTRDRDRIAGYVRAARRLSRDAHTHLLEERPDETAQAIYRVICALASAEKEGDDQ